MRTRQIYLTVPTPGADAAGRDGGGRDADRPELDGAGRDRRHGHFRLQDPVSTDGGRTYGDLAADTGSTATTYAHMGLTGGTTRHYRVAAINSAGTGVFSEAANATTVTVTVPGAPTGLARRRGARRRST